MKQAIAIVLIIVLATAAFFHYFGYQYYFSEQTHLRTIIMPIVPNLPGSLLISISALTAAIWLLPVMVIVKIFSASIRKKRSDFLLIFSASALTGIIAPAAAWFIANFQSLNSYLKAPAMRYAGYQTAQFYSDKLTLAGLIAVGLGIAFVIFLIICKYARRRGLNYAPILNLLICQAGATVFLIPIS